MAGRQIVIEAWTSRMTESDVLMTKEEAMEAVNGLRARGLRSESVQRREAAGVVLRTSKVLNSIHAIHTRLPIRKIFTVKSGEARDSTVCVDVDQLGGGCPRNPHRCNAFLDLNANPLKRRRYAAADQDIPEQCTEPH